MTEIIGEIYKWNQKEHEKIKDFVCIDSCDEDSDEDHGEDGENIDPWKRFMERMVLGENPFERSNHQDQSESESELQRLQNVRENKNCHQWANMKYTLYIRLQRLRPALWRKIEVPANLPLDIFQDRVLSPSLGWCRGYHCYLFNVPGRQHHQVSYGPKNSFAADALNIEALPYCQTLVNDENVYIGDLLNKPGDRIRYIYNLTECWKHEIILDQVEILQDADLPIFPILLDGYGQCPGEDTGGAYAYGRYLKSLTLPKHKILNWDMKYQRQLDITLRAKEYQNKRCKERGLDPYTFDIMKTSHMLHMAWNSPIRVISSHDYFQYIPMNSLPYLSTTMDPSTEDVLQQIESNNPISN